MKLSLPTIAHKHCHRLDKAGEALLWILFLILPLSMVTALRECAMFASLGLVLFMLLGHTRQIYRDRIWIMWALLFLTALISLFFSVDVGYSLSSIRRELLKWIIFFFAGLHIISTPEALARMWRIILLGFVLMCLAGVFLFLSHLTDWTNILNFTELRAKALCMGYGHFASYIAIMLPYLLVTPRAFNLKNPALWFLWALTLILALVAAYITYTRILWFCIPLTAVLYFWFLSHRRWLIGLAGLALLLTILAGLINSPQHSHGEKWQQLSKNPQELGGTTGDLLKLWKLSSEQLQTNPLVGVGFGRYNFANAYPEFVQANHNNLRHTHNVFMDWAMQTGVQGMLALLALLAFILARLWPHAPPESGDLPTCFRLATIMMLFSYMLRNQVDSYLVEDPAQLFWLLCGLALASRRLTTLTDKEL